MMSLQRQARSERQAEIAQRLRDFFESPDRIFSSHSTDSQTSNECTVNMSSIAESPLFFDSRNSLASHSADGWDPIYHIFAQDSHTIAYANVYGNCQWASVGALFNHFTHEHDIASIRSYHSV